MELDSQIRVRYKSNMKRIKDLREARGLTQQELADLVSATQSTIHKLETGKRPISRHWAEKLAPHLGTTPGALVGWEGGGGDWSGGTSDIAPASRSGVAAPVVIAGAGPLSPSQIALVQTILTQTDERTAALLLSYAELLIAAAQRSAPVPQPEDGQGDERH